MLSCLLSHQKIPGSQVHIARQMKPSTSVKTQKKQVSIKFLEESRKGITRKIVRKLSSEYSKVSITSFYNGHT
jgi:hypothetical protein